ncbi:non-ribosomal peptide synthetase [Corynebacterium bovis]|uniref:non-ribosomal peptide synthetase n=1 Tax=Corynebacterium bovis TaxID=36808 RepID=UPI000F64D526|nr:AMP-binding protein [Corynebacterium bovis]RRO81785.1 hypothetical protein CXF36_06545 [Corynebacterium bovis]
MVVPDPRGGGAADGPGVTDGPDATAAPEVPVVVADDVRVLAGHVSLAAGTPLVLVLPGGTDAATAGDTAAGTTGTPAPAPGDVLAVCHHAVVDSVSWMIVEDDLRAAVAAVLDGTDPDAATTTEVVPLRAAAVADLLGAHGPFLDDLAHWRALHALPRPVPDAVRWPTADTVTVRASVAGDVARTLHDAAPEILGVTVQDIVTGVVSAAVSRALGGPAATGRPGGPGGPGDDDAPSWAVDVEGHGRPDDTDVSRTVGWFTTVAPVALPAGDDPVAAAVAAARARAGHADGTLPDRRGHLALRHLHPGAAAELAGGAQILVNYLGRGESDAVLPAPTVEQGVEQAADHAADHATDQGVDHATDHIVEADVWTTSAGDLAADLTVVASVLAQHGVDPRDLAAHVRDLCGDLVGHVHGVVDHGTREVPLTVLQRGIYFQSQVAPAGAYVAQTELVLDNRLDPEALVRAFRDTVTVHPAMGASFGTDADGRPVQHLPWTGRRVTLPVTVVAAADRERAGGLDAVREADRHTAFDTAAAPLARATVIRGWDGEPGDTLLFTYHLVLIDGWSRAIMLRTLLERLTAWTRALGGADGAATAPAAPTPARPGVADVVRDLAAAADPEADVAYWVDRLAGLPAPTTVADGDCAAETADLPHQVHVDLGREWTARLTATLRDLGATLTSAVTAATGLTLGVATGETDVVFGQSVSGRDLSPDPAVDGVVGLLLNTVPARVTPRPGQSLADLVAAAHRDRVDAMPHDGVDLGDVQRATGWDRLLDSIVVVQNFLDPAAAEELRREHGVVAESAEDSTHFPLTWVFTPGESLHLKIEHRADLVDADRARALADTVTAVLKAVAEDPSQPVAGAVPVDAATAAALPDRGTLAAWQGLPVEGDDAALPPAGTPAVPDAGATGADADTADADADTPAADTTPALDGTVVDVIHRTALAVPDRTAVVCGDVAWTFRDLAGRCAAVAAALRDVGAGPGATVAVAVDRSTATVAAILGALWAGARYVPLDPAHPDGRLRVILDDCRPDAVVVDPGLTDRLAGLTDAPLVDVTAQDPVAAPPAPAAGLADDAYVIYTSGSTGTPKGVVVQHDGLAAMLGNHRRRIFAPAVEAVRERTRGAASSPSGTATADRDATGDATGDATRDMTGTGTTTGDPRETPVLRVAHAVSFAFDMSWEELFWLADGHEVHILDEDLRHDAAATVAEIRRVGIDVVNVTPSLAEQLLAVGMLSGDGHAPGLVLLGGEAVSPAVWSTLRDTPGVRGYNLYGPTEYTINALGAGTDESATPVIGTPVDRTAALVLDRWLRPVPDGVPGELYLAGTGLARSYHGLAGRTAAAMTACPFGAPGGRMYRTGDVVRRRADGMVEYLGRSDDQVKIRGHRVDPGEVSATVTARLGDRVSGCVTVPVAGGAAGDDGDDGAAAGVELACHLVAPDVAAAGTDTGTDSGTGTDATGPDSAAQALVREARAVLRDVLPSYMVPSRWSVVAELPLTVNGKVDLAALGPGERVAETGRAPRGEMEEVVAEIVADAIDVDPGDVPADADFFDIGGHSMAAIRLTALLRGDLGGELTVRDIYALRTVEALAAALEEAGVEP